MAARRTTKSRPASSRVPASIRNNNPGAQWPGPSSVKFGSKRAVTLTDRQRNQMAVFPTKVQGAAAQFDLLLRLYCGKTLYDAIEMWSGQNSAESYTRFITSRTGLGRNDILTHEYVANPVTGIPFAKAMAFWEAGNQKEYPLSDDEWAKAHAMAVGSTPAVPPHLEIFQQWADQGLKEFPGKTKSNPLIDEMFLICGHPKGKFRDDTAWCAIAAYASVAMTGGYILSPNEGNTMARSFLRWGVPVKENDIQPGDFRVETRKGANSPFGHVDVVEWVDHSRGVCGCIGGNVSNAVTRTVKPIKGAGVLGYRRREDAPKPLITAARESPSVMMMVRGGLLAAFTAVGEFFNFLPGAHQEVQQTVGLTREVTETVGISLPASILTALAVACFVVALSRMVSNRRDDA